MKPNISNHISYEEAKRSTTGEKLGIANEIPVLILPVMQTTANKIFEPVRTHFDRPIQVLSFYRCHAVNKAVGGSATSQHMSGEAMDIKATGGFTSAEIFHFIKDNLEYDQVIWEFGTNKEPDWVHVSYTTKRKNRMQALRAVKVNGTTIYKPF